MNADLFLVAGLSAVVATSLWLSWIDVREHRLPNRIVGPLAVGVAAWILLLGVVHGDLGRSGAALAWGCVGFATFLFLHLAAGLGMGDVKYAWPIAATLGWFGGPSVEVALYALVVSGGLAGVVSLMRGKGTNHRMAYGPFMAFGLCCGIVHGLL